MPLQIIKGKKPSATRAVFYGQEGVGKSTLAAKIPGALIIDTEDGTGQIDAARVVAPDWRAIEHAVKELVADTQGFTAVIIDTADWMEKALIEHVLRQAGKKSIEDFGYGKGYTILQEHVVRFLGQVDQLIAKNVHVVFVAHSKVTRVSPPDQTDGFDRYELKLTKQVAPLLKEWADLVLFAAFRVQVVEGSDGRLKAQGGKERVLYATHSAAWDAKNRFGLPDELPMEFDKIAHLFAAVAAVPTPKQAKAAAVEAAVAADPAPVEVKRATPEQVAQIKELSPASTQLVEGALAYCEAVDLEELTHEVAEKLIADLMAAATPEFKWPANVEKFLEENGHAVNAYLVHVGWLERGQGWGALTTERCQSIVDRFAKFSAAVLSHAKVGRKAA